MLGNCFQADDFNMRNDNVLFVIITRGKGKLLTKLQGLVEISDFLLFILLLGENQNKWDLRISTCKSQPELD